MNINNKNVFLLAPRFFNYEYDIKEQLEMLGANVSFYDEKPFKSFLGRSLIRFNFKKTISFFKKRYFKKVLTNNAFDIDFLIIINPESICVDILQRLKKLNPNIKIVVYMWDSFLNKKNAMDLIPVSDRFFTFDPKDAKDYDITLLPLFYVNDYTKIKYKKSYQYDFCFIGTAHSQRASLVQAITKYTHKKFIFYFTPSFFVFAYKRFICNELKGLKLRDVSTKKMNRDAIINIIQNSKVIIDINHPSQIGLTMRTIETIGANRKLITTNQAVVKYDFYNENNILVYKHNETTLSDIACFLDRPYIELDSVIYQNYHIGSWVNNLLS